MTITCPPSCPFHTKSKTLNENKGARHQDQTLGLNRRVANKTQLGTPDHPKYRCTVCEQVR